MYVYFLINLNKDSMKKFSKKKIVSCFNCKSYFQNYKFSKEYYAILKTL